MSTLTPVEESNASDSCSNSVWLRNCWKQASTASPHSSVPTPSVALPSSITILSLSFIIHRLTIALFKSIWPCLSKLPFNPWAFALCIGCSSPFNDDEDWLVSVLILMMLGLTQVNELTIDELLFTGVGGAGGLLYERQNSTDSTKKPSNCPVWQTYLLSFVG